MSYLDDVCLALAHVLDRASFHRDARLAGYAANLDFWMDEIRHCLDCIAGYERRFNRLLEARKEYASAHGIELDPSMTKRASTDDELRRLEQRVKSSAQSFLKVCCKSGYVDHKKQREIEAYLGIRINYSHALD